MTQDEFDRLFERFISGSLSAEEAATLRACLAVPDWQRRWRRLSDLDGMMAQELAVGQPETSDVSPTAAKTASHVKVSVRHRRSSRRQTASNWPVWAVAATAALLLIAVLLNRGGEPKSPPVKAILAEIRAINAPVFIMNAAGRREARRGDGLSAGDTIEATGKGSAAVAYSDGTRLELVPAETGNAARVQLQVTPSGGKGVSVESGILDADVIKQKSPLVIATPNAQAVVLGTRFRLNAAAASTRLDVNEGRVQFARQNDSKSVEVGAGQYAVVAEGVTLAVLSQQSPAAPPAKSEPQWLSLFSASGLSEWVTTRGQARIENGIVVLDAQDEKSSRIETKRSYTDFEFTCRMRATKRRLAEFQFHDYRWFFQLRWDQLGVWKELKVTVRGNDMTATLDGVKQTLERGEGRQPNGPLGIFVTESGRLEISDARLRELAPAK